MNLFHVYHEISHSAQREIQQVLVRRLGDLSGAVSRECANPDGELPLDQLQRLAQYATAYRTILQIARRRSGTP
jgi:hypothetical protein